SRTRSAAAGARRPTPALLPPGRHRPARLDDRPLTDDTEGAAMKLMFTLRGSNDTDTDLVATVDGRTTVGDLAEHLVLADPERQRSGSSYHDRADLGQHTLALVDENFRAVDPN